MRGRTLVVTLLAALAAAAPAGAQGDPVMPLAEVRPGMQCTGYSVFRGTAVEPFDVEVLDVVGQPTTGATGARILVRVSGERVDATGIGPGFSGSPIYCPRADGVAANIGAISETIGEYGSKTVLATPIERILGTPVDQPVSPASRRAAPARASRREARLLASTKPLTAPFTIRGLSRGLHRAVARAASRRGIALLQAPPFPIAAPGPQTLVPGSAMGTGYSSGDLTFGAVGTVAYTDGPNVWGFGHGLEGAGSRALLLQDAYVSTVINNPVQTPESGGTYKLAGAVNDLGTLSSDGFDAVAGRVGALPPTIPVRVYSEDADRPGHTGEMLVTVADETDVGNPTGLSPMAFIAPLAISQGATDTLGSSPLRVAGQMCFQTTVREIKKPLRFCNRYVSDGTFGATDGSIGNIVALAAGGDAAGALGLIDTYKGAGLHVTEVSARVRMTRGQRMAYLRAVRLPRRVRRGSTVRAQLVVKVVRGARRVIPFDWRVPRSLRAGTRTLRFRGSEPDGAEDFFGTITITLGDFEEETDTEGPRTLKQLADAFRGFQRWDGVRLRGHGRVHRDRTYRIGGSAEETVRVLP
jgi:hypothetical protein